MQTVKVLKETEDATIYRVLTTPFGSPDRKDLHKEFFHQDTDFGDEYGVYVKFAMYEHLMNAQTNPHMPSGKQIIGKATFAAVDEWGRWFDFEVKRSLEYHDYIRDLVDMGLMGASSQAYPGGKTLDPTILGKIDRWIESEVSMTPTPSNPDTIGQIEELVKTYGLKFTVKSEIDANDGEGSGDDDESETDATSEDNASPDLESEIDDIFAQGEVDDEADTPNSVSDETEIKALLVGLQTEVTEMKAGFNLFLELWGYGEDDDPREAIADLLGMPKSIAGQMSELETQVRNQGKGLKAFARNIKALTLQQAADQWAKMSPQEREAWGQLEDEQDTPPPKFNHMNDTIPSNAPGS